MSQAARYVCEKREYADQYDTPFTRYQVLIKYTLLHTRHDVVLILTRHNTMQSAVRGRRTGSN